MSEERPIQDLSDDLPNSASNLVLKEAYRNEAAGQDAANRHELTQSLSEEYPNRLYVTEDGTILRILLFSTRDRRAHSQRSFKACQLHGEIIRQQNDGSWEQDQVLDSDTINPHTAENEVSHWRRRFDANHDLLTNPDEVYRVEGANQILGPEYIHTVRLGDGRTVIYRYFIEHPGQPHTVSLSIEQEITIDENESLVPLKSPPEVVLSYANPFA